MSRAQIRPPERRSGPSTGSGQALASRRRPAALPSPSSTRPGIAARLGRAWRAAACALAVGLALLSLAGEVAAQSNYELVGNIRQTIGATSFQLSNKDRAVSFTTGSTAATLSSIDVNFFQGAISTVTVTLATGVSSTSAGTVVATMSRSSLPSGNQRFTAPANTTLSANTTYFVVIEGNGGRINHTTSNSEDSQGQTGWSVANTSFERLASQTGGWTEFGFPIPLIRINGQLDGSAVPAAPAPPTVSTTAGTSLTVNWTAPASTVPAITDYDVEYRRTGDTDWTSHAHTGTALTTTITTGIVRGASYQARVRATNAEGTSGWSNAGSGHTGAAQVESAETNEAGTEVRATFTKDISGSGTPVSNFTITITGNTNPSRTPSAISISGRVLTLTARDRITTGETVSLRYTKPSSGTKLTDSDGLDIANITGQSVTNNAITVTELPAPPAVPASGALVSNTGQASWSVANFTTDVAQAFATGPNVHGYKLTRVDLVVQGAANIDYRVAIHSNSAGRPGAMVPNGTLNRPADHAGEDLYPASGDGIDLDPDTIYWVVIDSTTSDARGTIWGTNTNAEDAGKAAGWSIANVALRRGAASTSSSDWAAHPDGAPLKIAIHGDAKGSRPGFFAAGGLVSNTGIADGLTGQSRTAADFRQAFTTGPNAGGYRVTRVDLDMRLQSGATVSSYSVNIRPDSSGSPGGILKTLVTPPIVASNQALVRHAVPGGGIDLAPNTTYWLEYTTNEDGKTSVFLAAPGQDAGAAAGWSIADGGLWKGDTTWNASSPLTLAIHGEKRADPPPTVAVPTLSERDGTTLTVSWTAPENARPAVSDYDVRYRRKGDTAWIDHPHTGASRSAAILNLLQGASWEAQVRATNAVGTGAWSQAGAGHTGPARFVSAVNGVNKNDGLWRVVSVRLTKDLLPGTAAVAGTLTVAVNGADRPTGGGFGSDGRIVFAVTSPFQAGDTITVSYDKSAGTPNFVDIDGEEVASFSGKTVENTVPAAPSAPGKPSTPTVTQVSGKRALTVSWTAPSSDGGAPVTDYDLRYFKGTTDATNDDDWTVTGEVSAATSATLTGLDASSGYRVQVRAKGPGGAGPWSDSGSATTGSGATAPAAPAPPTVAAVASKTDLMVTWTAPSTGGSAITDYDVRYFQGSADPTDEADWVTENRSSGLSRTASTALTRTVSGLKASTAYRVQVRAGNAQGEGPWSASGSATTNAATGTNSPPSRMELGTNSCVTTTTELFETATVQAGFTHFIGALVGQGFCVPGSTRIAPMFHDPDGDTTLTFTARVPSLPSNVRLASGIPVVQPNASLTGGRSGTVLFLAAAALRQTDVRVDITATDPHGASASGHAIIQVGTFTGTSAPSLEAVESRRFAANAAIEPFVLPAATGGDVSPEIVGNTYEFFYTYAVTGLPPGLSFDAATRTVSGTPTAAGSYSVTYTADDADSAFAGKPSATAADKADTASRTFTIEVGKRPKINRIRIVSRPTYDSDGDGTNDTYVRGDTIFVDVEFGGNQPVALGGAKTVKLRLDLGADDSNLGNSQRVLTLDPDNLIYADEVLRFTYRVKATDTDTSGVWVQPESASSTKVLFLEGNTTLTHADTGVAADLTFGELTMRGDPLHKVDGAKTSADTGPRPTGSGASVNGATLTLTYNGDLATLGNEDLSELRYAFAVQGAGGIHSGDKTHSQHPKTIAMSTRTVTLTLSAPARSGDTVTLSYAGELLRGSGASGKTAPPFRDLAVTNDTGGAAAGPKPLRATVSERTLRVVFDGTLDTSSTPAGSWFEVETRDSDEDARTIRGTGTASVDGTVVTVTLARPVRGDEDASVTYYKPDAAPLRGAATGNPEVRPFRRFHLVAVSDAGAPAPLGGAVAETGTSPPRSRMALYFSEALDASSVPAAADFAVRAGTNLDAVTVSGVAVSGNSVVLTLNRRATAGTAFTVAYTPGANPIRDRSGNAAAAFSQTLSAAAGAPALRTAAVDGSRIVLTYDKALDPGSLPGTGAFSLHQPLHLGERVEVTGYSLTAVAVEGRKAVLRLDDPVFPCWRKRPFTTPFTLSYSKPDTAPLQGLDGTAATHAGQAGITYLNVTNARAGWCGLGWFDSSRIGSVIVRSRVPFDTSVEPQPEWFTVTASGGPVTVTGSAYSGDDPYELKLTVDREFGPDETVTVSYTRPEDASGLWDVTGNQLADIEDRPVENAAAVPARLESAATDAQGRGLVLTFTRDIALAGLHTDYTVMVDDARRATRSAFWDGATVGLVLAEPVRRGETVTVAYARPESGVALRDANDLAIADFGPVAVANAVAKRPARFESAATDTQGRGVLLTFTKDIALAGPHTDYTVMVDGARRATRSAFWEGATVGLVLAAPVRRGETVTVAYAKPASGVALRDADDLAVASFGPAAVENASVRVPNRRATGAPVIEGTARVGETLTASTADIADPDGLTGAAFAYQWISKTGGTAAEIAGATGSSYTLTGAEEGRRVWVRVTFTDDAGNAERLASAATGAVAPPLPPLTAEFVDMPAEHDGQSLFRFELRFSEDFPGRLNYQKLRDHALRVTDGTVREAKRIVGGRNDRWTIAVRPSSHEDVTIALPATTDCALPGAICTEDGRMLSNTATATVRGPAALSVADAEATEGADEAVEFAVTLSRAASGEVRVDYVTRDGTATAGEDYTFTRGTLTFAAGETEKTVAVPILDDVLDEGSETFTLKLRNAQGAAIADGEATGTIKNADPLQKMWLSRFGRTVAGHVTEAVSDRLSTPLRGAQVTVGGQSVDLARAQQDEAWLGETLTSLARAMGAPDGPEAGDDFGSATGAGGLPALDSTPDSGSAAMRDISGREVLLGSAFHLAEEGDGTGPGLAAWGRVTVGGFDGEAPAEVGNVRIEGEVTTGILGADAEWSRVLAGVAVSVSEGEGTFDQPGVDSGTIESTMTAVSPYARFMVNDQVSAWGLAGFGSGDMTIVQAANDRGQPERVTRTDIEMRLAAVGGRGVLMEAGESGAVDLALKADAFYVETEAEPVSNEGSTTAAASRVRLILEGSRAFDLGGGAVLTPGLELGLRHDGGDAETGSGVELGGRVSWADPGTGFSVEARARTLVAHADSNYEEWGASATARFGPGERGRGLSFSLSPTLGAASSGTEGLWGAQRPGDFAPDGGFEASRGLQGELGYGLGLGGDRFTGTPNLGFGLSDGAREYRIGWRLTSAVRGDPGFRVDLDATRREAANGNAPPEHGVMLRGAIRW